MTRHQHVRHADAIADRLALNPHVVEAAQRHQVGDRVAYRTYRQSIPDTGLDQPQHGGVVHDSALFIELDFDDRLADLCARFARAMQNAKRTMQTGHYQPAPHQNVFLMRQSRA